jgi:APA family basic amino acid/polyamine antiporter
LFDAGSRFLGRWNAPVIVFAAVAAIGTTINAIYLTFTRFLFAMGQDRILPAALADIHPRWATPHVAILAVFCCGVAGLLLLPSSILFLFLAVNLPTMTKYFFNCLAAARLATGHPDLLARARFRLKGGTVRAWAYAGMVSSVVLFVAGFTADWRPYGVLATWAVAGALYWQLRALYPSRRARHHVVPAELQ